MSRIQIATALWTTVATAVLLPSAEAAPPQPLRGASVPYGQNPGYVVLDAPLNPVPHPNIPVQTGATMITNQALYPHEMLYPHRYRAMYPPFYYKVTGGWKVTPWGVRSYERWKLQGTEVKVKYHSSISPFALFSPPSVR